MNISIFQRLLQILNQFKSNIEKVIIYLSDVYKLEVILLINNIIIYLYNLCILFQLLPVVRSHNWKQNLAINFVYIDTMVCQSGDRIRPSFRVFDDEKSALIKSCKRKIRFSATLIPRDQSFYLKLFSVNYLLYLLTAIPLFKVTLDIASHQIETSALFFQFFVSFFLACLSC